jgi:uncharacterized DUF497 family protein
MIEFDPDKDRQNITKHGISLTRAGDMDVRGFASSHRHAEARSRAYGIIDGRWYCLIYTVRADALRAISLRRAHDDEVFRYVEKEN